MEQLDKLTDAPLFSLNDQTFDAKVVNAYDGDTIKCVFEFKGEYYKWNCRLNGIDTPELRTKDLEEKKMGIIARDALREKILNKVVKLKCHKFDKYGRLLVDVYYEDTNMSEWMISSGFGKSYDGGTKEGWADATASGTTTDPIQKLK